MKLYIIIVLLINEKEFLEEDYFWKISSRLVVENNLL